MNTNKFTLISLLACCIISINTYAQFSIGGTPKGFSPKINQSIPIAKMPAFDPTAMLLEDETLNQKGNGPYRFGKNFDVNLNQSNAGSWFTYANGDRLWQLEISSTNAYSINLQFSYYHLPPDAEMFIYNKTKSMVIGAFTHLNNQEDGLFATDLVQGDKIVVEYFEPVQVRGLGAFNISTVTHAYRNIFSEEFTKGFGTSGACQFNTACPLSTGWEDQIRSSVMLVSGGNGFCSGSLVNNTALDGKPYILTANHCGSSGFGSWVFRFNWESPTCNNPASSPSFQSLTGGVRRANSAGSDMSLVEITGGLSGGTIPASYNAYFSGWSNLNIIADSAFGIHHPDGDIKKFSIAKNATQNATYAGAACWRVGQWTSGCTEGGSSGSPLYDQNKRIIGQLYGGPSYCGAPASQMNDFYGKFSTSWLGGGTNSTQLKFWLDPNNTGATTLDGYDPNAVQFALDASIVNIVSPAQNLNTCNTSVTPSLNVKNNGINTLTSFMILYTLDAGLTDTLNWTGSLVTSQTVLISLPIYSNLTFGNHTIVVTLVNPNDSLDLNTVNNQKTVSFTVINPSPLASVPVFQGAETVPFPGNNWTILNPDNNTTWTASSAASGLGNSSKCFKIDNYGSDFSGQSDFIVSPYMDFSNAVTPLRVNYNVAYARYSTTGTSDSLIVSVSINCGETWTRISGKGGLSLSTVGNTVNTSAFTPTATQWRNETLNLNSFIGNDHVQIRFQNKSNYGNNLYIDDINIANSFTDLLEKEAENGITLSPNPSNGRFKIVSNNKNVFKEISIVNAIGQIIYSNTKNSANTIDLELNLPVGIYFVKVNFDQTQTIQKLVINN
jgi:hypothetical protein